MFTLTRMDGHKILDKLVGLDQNKSFVKDKLNAYPTTEIRTPHFH